MSSSLFFNRKLEVATLLGDLFHEAEIETQTEGENKHEYRGGNQGRAGMTGRLGLTHAHY